MAASYWIESITGEQSPSTFGFTIDSGNASGQYYIQDVTSVNDLYEFILQLTGDVSPTATTTNLQRTLPMQHPFLPWYTTGASNLCGVGANYQVITNDFNPLNPQVASFCLYNQYKATVNFQPRPYPVFDDSFVQLIDSWWYPEGADNVQESYIYCNEWERFTDIDIAPSNDSVTVQFGQMAFNALSLPANSKPFLAMPRQLLDNSVLKFTWYQIPMSYWSSTGIGNGSYFTRFRGRVNQDDWVTSNFGTFYAGELLFLGASIKRYTPPLTEDIIIYQGLNGFQKYCNVELTFLYTRRILGQNPLSPPLNNNYIVAGHNLNPYFGSACDPLSQTFLYTSTVGVGTCTNSAPLWLSGPLDIIFSSPYASEGAI